MQIERLITEETDWHHTLRLIGHLKNIPQAQRVTRVDDALAAVTVAQVAGE